MTRKVAFLRGMNLGRRRIKNEELIEIFSELGLVAPVAFLASGNVIFETKRSGASLERFLEDGLARHLDYEVPTFVRTAAELAEIAQADPFATRPGPVPSGKLQVVFLKSPPKKAPTRALAELESCGDWLALRGRELYWIPQGGISQSELSLKAVEQLLGPHTARTHNTVTRLLPKLKN